MRCALPESSAVNDVVIDVVDDRDDQPHTVPIEVVIDAVVVQDNLVLLEVVHRFVGGVLDDAAFEVKRGVRGERVRVRWTVGDVVLFFMN